MIKSWQERTEMLLGAEKLERLSNSLVVVAGVGGVGSYAAEMLIRAGIGRLVLIDCDVVSETNKNRQLLALDSTIGKSKCEVMKSRLVDINPEADIVIFERYILSDKVDYTSGEIAQGISIPKNGAKIAEIFSEIVAEVGVPDFVVDAIDTLSPKIALIKHCMQQEYPLVSAMGAGAKYDITKIRITDISKTFQCPLAYMVRKKLRKEGIHKGFQAVFSEELPDRESMVRVEENNKKSQVGTISYMPAVFGCACAQAVLSNL